ncbi:MAG: CopD family protein [Rubrivivax sp.]|nr:CopD family protein [Rubrivivax sp.]
MFYLFLKAVHVLAVVLWVGGMAFAHFFLRPSLATLAPPQRLTLMRDVLRRFFSAVLVATGLVVASGLWMIGRVVKQVVQAGGSFSWPLDWLVMTPVGLLMVAIFGVIRFRFHPRLSAAVDTSDWPAAGAVLGDIRRWVGVNLVLGVALTAFVIIH